MKKQLLTLAIIYALAVFAVLQPITPVHAQNPPQQDTPIEEPDATDEYDEAIPDPTGQERYTLTGVERPASQVFTIPRYNPRQAATFFDGWSEKGAADIGIDENAEVWVEFGKIARQGHLESGARFMMPNGLESREGYIIGCTLRIKKGRHKGKRIKFFNRVKFPLKKKKVVPPAAPAPPMCWNIRIKVEDVPANWTKSIDAEGHTICTPPVPETPAPIDNTCVPGTSSRIFERHDKKGFNPTEALTAGLANTQYKLADILRLMSVTESTAKVSDLIVYSDGCNYLVFAHSIVKVKGGLGWWKWVIPALLVGAFVLGHYLWRNDCKVQPMKVENIPPNIGGLSTGGFRL